MTATLRAIRVQDELWKTAQTIAQAEGTNLSQIMRDALTAYVEGHTKNVEN